MEAVVAVAKVGKYATSESGDSLEMIERPGGGLSFVLADGQRSGKAAKAISNVVVRKAISLLSEGVRDGAAARAASDYLFTYRGGKVSATLNILSIDLQTETIVITRNNPAPVFIVRPDGVETLDSSVSPVGVQRNIRPHITEIPLKENLAVVLFSDGLTHAGDRKGDQLDVRGFVQQLSNQGLDARAWADRLLEEALRRDEGRPVDDISVVVAAVQPRSTDDARRLTVRVPL